MPRKSFKAIAERKLVLRRNDGTERDITVQIGKPYWVDEAAEDAACPCAIIGLYPDLPDIRGMDLYQALQLAIRVVDLLLEPDPSGSTQILWPNRQLYDDLARPPFLPTLPYDRDLTHFARATVRMEWPDSSKEVLVEPKSRTYQPIVIVDGQDEMVQTVFVDGPPVVTPGEPVVVTMGLRDPDQTGAEALQPGASFSIRWAFNTEVGRGTVIERWVAT